MTTCGQTQPTENLRGQGRMQLEPLMLAAKDAAKLFGKSLRTWRTWDALGLIPKPARIMHSTLWRLEELKAWAQAGCPRRAEWEART
jgi:hypothetical protein